ncbi:hypothetical protein Back11_48660 [Paenibacillus baekrokdamisoli]|uniref:Uncharacterized protein n=1 Tax=Paenibacillus baekrokdamisoli TaxID=1712516 RepID=A0A3G9JC62_9BACL|nr:hypothetical protein [Paenibacillus baekrokdamisoli]MBB3068689.1 D-mannonate dehydratase [Paenibacillus baekrokdamisoli]BBH23521.1 hypothetical protein Back11_48660 [Paenibacillus baekrokdamisoli]
MKIAELLNQSADPQWTLSKQAGVTHAVGRLPTKSNGEVSWDYMALLQMKKRFDDFGLKLEVLELAMRC